MSCFSVSYSVLHPFAMDVIKDQMSFPNDEDSSIPAPVPAGSLSEDMDIQMQERDTGAGSL